MQELQSKKRRTKLQASTVEPTKQDSYVFENEQWQMANNLRNNMDAAEYKHVVLGLIFLKYISDSFMEQHAKIKSAKYGDPEDRDEYTSENIFWVPESARWQNIMSQARSPSIGRIIDDAMGAIERKNATLKDVLPKIYGSLRVDKSVLGQLVDRISNIPIGDEESRSEDVLGRIYEYFLSQFASSEGKKGGEFYTPRSVVRLLVEMLEPYDGKVYDPCCGSAGMFVQSKEFIRSHATSNGNGGKARGTIRVYGQESNHTTWRLAKMNLAIRGIEGDVRHGDSFHDDQHPDLKADFILANPPFNVSKWGSERLQEDVRWQYGIPPKNNANFAWVQHMAYHLSPAGRAGFVLANGSMSSNQSGEGDIRRKLIEANLVDCMVALPGQLFYSTQIPACLWFMSRDRVVRRRSTKHNKVLFIDARNMGRMIDRTHRVLDVSDIDRIANTYHSWRGSKKTKYTDVQGFCKSATLDEIRRHDYVLTPGRYVGTEEHSDDNDESFEKKILRLTSQWRKQQSEARKLDGIINKNMKSLGIISTGDDA